MNVRTECPKCHHTCEIPQVHPDHPDIARCPNCYWTYNTPADDPLQRDFHAARFQAVRSVTETSEVPRKVS